MTHTRVQKGGGGELERVVHILYIILFSVHISTGYQMVIHIHLTNDMASI